jgi:chitinase
LGAQNNGGGVVTATATAAQAWETFSLVDVNGGALESGDSVLIQAGNGQFFQALNGGGSTLNAASANQLGWETFKLVRQGGSGSVVNGDVVGLQAASGSWISAQDGGGGNVFAYGGALGSWEQLAIGGLAAAPVPPPPSAGPTTVANISLRTTLSSTFVGAQNDGGGAVVATATAAQAWETFAFIDVNGGQLESGDSVFIRAGNGQYFQALNGGGASLNAASHDQLGWETFKVVRQAGSGPLKTGDVVGLQASSGSWISAENGGGGNVLAYGGALGSWESFRIGVGAPAPGNPGQPSQPSGSGLASILSEAAFNSMFPGRNGFYSYAGLVSAAATFGAFANSGDTTARKREVAAFLANVGHETGNLVYIEEINKSDYCSSSGACPCAPGKRYYGRGPLQLSWNFNYCTAGNALGLDLRGNPDLVAQDSTISWRTGLWFWMTSGGAGARPAHESIVNGFGFGETVRTINGSLECNGGNWGAVQSRINRYLDFCGRLGVDPGGGQGC